MPQPQSQIKRGNVTGEAFTGTLLHHLHKPFTFQKSATLTSDNDTHHCELGVGGMADHCTLNTKARDVVRQLMIVS